MPSLALYYFGEYRRSEVIRMLLAYSSVPYEDIRIKRDDWPELKKKMPFGQLPVLDIDGFKLSETIAIARYLARESGLAGKTTWEQARADMYMDGLSDVRDQMKELLRATLKGDQVAAEGEFEKFQAAHLNTFLTRYNDFLIENGGMWFVGDAVTWADFGITEFLYTLEETYRHDIVSKYPALKDLILRVFSLPQLLPYLSQRDKPDF